MRTLGVFIALLVLCSFGLSIGGLLWESDYIPAWLISFFLLPAALFLDCFAKEENQPSKVKTYLTTLGVLCMTLTGILLNGVPGCTDSLCSHSAYSICTPA